MRSSRLSLIAVMAAVAFGVATAIWAAAGPFASNDPFPAAQPSCAAPDLAGTVVDVTLTDGGPMQPSVTGPATTRRGVVAPGATWPTAGGSSDRVVRRSGYPYPGMGMGTMRIMVNPATVPAGTVSLQVRNTGTLTHRVVVLPLAQGRFPGQRLSGLNGQVDESDSQGEVARTCGADDADGIAAGTTGWTTITLPTGRYELACNNAGHYLAGMYTELDVVAQPD